MSRFHPPARPRPQHRRMSMLVVVALTAIVCTSCVLTESKHYVIQTAPPSGVHVTLRHDTGALLQGLAYRVRQGDPVDGLLASNGYDVRCDRDTNSWESGDRCAFRVLGATPVAGGIATGLAHTYWSDAVASDEFSDFHNDAMAAVRAVSSRCLHVTIRNVGDWPVEWRDSNWTYRTSSDAHC